MKLKKLLASAVAAALALTTMVTTSFTSVSAATASGTIKPNFVVNYGEQPDLTITASEILTEIGQPDAQLKSISGVSIVFSVSGADSGSDVSFGYSSSSEDDGWYIYESCSFSNGSGTYNCSDNIKLSDGSNDLVITVANWQWDSTVTINSISFTAEYVSEMISAANFTYSTLSNEKMAVGDKFTITYDSAKTPESAAYAFKYKYDDGTKEGQKDPYTYFTVVDNGEIDNSCSEILGVEVSKSTSGTKTIYTFTAVSPSECSFSVNIEVSESGNWTEDGSDRYLWFGDVSYKVVADPSSGDKEYVSYEIIIEGATDGNLLKTIKVGESILPISSYAVLGTTADGETEAIDNPVLTWESNHPEFATVDEATGVVTGVSEGTAEIWAYYKGTKSTYCIVITVEAAENEGGGNPGGNQGGPTGGVPSTTTKPAVTTETVSAAAVEDIVTASDGDTVKVELKKGVTKIEKSVLSSLAGRNVTVQFDLLGGAYWEINGEDIEDAKDIDLGVKLNDNNIPEKKITELAGEKKTTQFSLKHNGDLGFTGVLNIPVSTKYNGQYANLYYYNKKGEFEFIGSSQISSGKVGFAFTHASDYVMVIDTFPYGDDVSSAASASETETAQTVPYAGIVILTALMGVSILTVRRRLAK